MAVQSNYSERHNAAFAGMLADTQHAVIISRTVEDNAMGFGIVAVQGAADGGVTDSDATHTKFVGITIRDQSQAPDSVNAYPVGASAGLVVEGVVWVTVSGAVAAGDPVYFVPASGALTKTATDNVLVAGARFETSAADGGLAQIRLA